MRFTNKQQCEVLRQLNKFNELRIILTTVSPCNIFRHKEILSKDKTLILNNNAICYLDKNYFNKINFKASYDSDINDLFKLPSYHNYIALQILERNERYSGEISFEERNYLIKMQYLFWSRLLMEHPPEYVIFGDIPHMYYEFVLMDLINKLGIKSFFIGNLLRDKHYFMDTNFKVITNLGDFSFSEACHERMQKALNFSQTEFDKVLGKSPFKDLPRYSNIFIKKIANIFIYFFLRKEYYQGYYIKKGYFKFGPNYKFNESYYDLKYLLKCIIFPFIYNFYSSKVDFEKEYFYLPLVSGYENGLHPNLSPLNIQDIVKSALSVLKPNTYLYIKEHPAQFVFRHHQRFARNFSFYKDILNLDNRIRFVKMGENPSKIIKKSIGVFAVNFTSSFAEAKAFKKKIYCIGSNLINGEKKYPFSELTESDEEIKFIHDGSIWVHNPIERTSIADKNKAKKLADSILKQVKFLNKEI